MCAPTVPLDEQAVEDGMAKSTGGGDETTGAVESSPTKLSMDATPRFWDEGWPCVFAAVHGEGEAPVGLCSFFIGLVAMTAGRAKGLFGCWLGVCIAPRSAMATVEGNRKPADTARFV